MAAFESAADFGALKQRQQAAWAAGDYSVIGVTLQIVGERLCEAVDIQSGETVLDVAAGNGNVSLAAARHWCHVTSTDFVEHLLDRARQRALAEGRHIEFRQADAEALPFEDASFDVVMSSFGVMFAPDQEQAARELARVCRPGGRIGLANWTPEGFGGDLFGIIARYIPMPPGVKSPTLWGDERYLASLFVGHNISVTRQHFNFRYLSAEHWLEIQTTYFGPTMRAFAALDSSKQAALQDELLAMANRRNRSKGGGLVIPAEYLQVVIRPR